MEDSPPHTLHLIQKMERKEVGPGNPQRQEEEDPELERMVDRARLATAAQFYDKNEKEGLVEIKPTGEEKENPRRTTEVRSGLEPSNIPPWSKGSLEKHTDKVKETLTLI